MLIKRTVYFSQVDQETGEEKLFSVKEKDFAQAEEEKKNTGKKVGKAVAVGTAGVAATGAAAYGAEKGINKLGDAVVKKVASKRVNGKFAKLTPAEKKIRDIAVKARDAKTIQNAVKKAGKVLRVVK